MNTTITLKVIKPPTWGLDYTWACGDGCCSETNHYDGFRQHDVFCVAWSEGDTRDFRVYLPSGDNIIIPSGGDYESEVTTSLAPVLDWIVNDYVEVVAIHQSAPQEQISNKEKFLKLFGREQE